MTRLARTILLCSALVATSAAHAQNVTPPPVETLVTALTPAATGPIVRSMSQSGNIPFQPDQFIPDGFDFPAYSVQVEFDGGHMLTSNGMNTLRSLAAALMDTRLNGAKLQVGVHVPQNNGLDAMPVSSRRAAVVVEHLTTFYGLPESSLVPFGYGNTKLLDQSNPSNPANERVELINVSALN